MTRSNEQHNTAARAMDLALVRPIDIPRLADEVAVQIQQLIISQDLVEGARLPSERDLSQRLGASRPTVSQAIRSLALMGLIETRRGSGAYVTRRLESTITASVNLMLDLNRESVSHLSDLRLWLETIGVTQAIERGTDIEVGEAELALKHLRDSTGDTASWISADTRFHAAIVRVSHNPYLASIFEGVHASLITYEYQSWVDKGTVPSWLRPNQAEALTALHEPILQALKTKDPEVGRLAVLHHHEVMTQHLAASHRRQRPRRGHT